MYGFPKADLVDCAEPHQGELITVDYAAGLPMAATDQDIRDADSGCQQDMQTRLTRQGLRPIAEYFVDGFLEWAPAVTVIGRAVGPTAGQRRAGAVWAGCAMVTLDGSVLSGSGIPGECLSGGTPAELTILDAEGSEAVAASGLRVSCSTAHHDQIVAWLIGRGGDPNPTEVRSSCEGAVRQFSGLTDVTAGGRIRVDALGGDYPVCLATVAGPGIFTGSLIGLGGAPIPWAG
jgi:hypothetical protein